MDHPPLELWFWGSQIALAIIGIIGVVFGGAQLFLIRAERVASTKNGRARFLLDLDQRWESQEMEKARRELRGLIDQVEAQLNHAGRDAGAKGSLERRMREAILYADGLKQIRRTDFPKYENFMRVWGFMETLGYLYRHHHITATEIDGLFGVSILQVDHISRLHLQERADETKTEEGAPGLYENALCMAAELHARNGSQPIGRP